MLAFNPSVWLSNYHLGIRIVQDRKNIFSVFFSGLQEAKITVYFPLHTCMQCIEKSCDNNSEQKGREREKKKHVRTVWWKALFLFLFHIVNVVLGRWPSAKL